ncbi:MAG: MFS transporter [Kineosporiaceae bacterium]
MTHESVTYGRILRRRGLSGLLLAAVLGRLAAGVVPFGAVAMFTEADSPSLAGVAFASFLLVGAFTGPARGRLVDRRGAATMLPIMAVAFGGLILLGALVADVAPIAALIALGLSPAAAPPSSAVLRSTWTAIAATREENRALHSLDSVLEEAGFVVSPLLTAGIWAVAGPRWAVAVGAGAALVGTALLLTFARASGGLVWETFEKRSPTAGVRAEGRSGGRRGVVFTRGGAALLAPMSGLGIAMGTAAVVLPAWAEHHSAPEVSGVILAVISLGGVAAGLLFGRVKQPRVTARSQYALALVAVASGTAVMGLSTGFPGAVAGALVLGAGMTPMFIVGYLLVGEMIEAGRHTEANAALGSAYNIGSGGAAAAAGALLSIADERVILLGAAALSLTALVAVMAWHREDARPEPVEVSPQNVASRG